MNNIEQCIATGICSGTLEACRTLAGSGMHYEMPLQRAYGRADAAATIYPTPENISAANEIGFLVDYSKRHATQA